MIRRSVFVYIMAAILILAGIILPEILGATRNDYSSLANYISELGATGTATQGLTNTLAFPMVGITCIATLIALWHRLPKAAGIRIGLISLGFGIPAGYFGATIFPCDYGCPIEGSASQTAHNLLGLVQYPLAMAIGFVMMIMPEQAHLRGAWQRLSDYTAFIVLAGFVLSTQPKWSASS